jgi:hypothetical protein
MPDVFKRAEVNYGGAMHAQEGVIGGSVTGLGILMQNLNLQYSLNVTRVYELGNWGAPTHYYYVSGRAQGTCTIGHILGPGNQVLTFYDRYGDVCDDNRLTIHTSNFCFGGMSLTADPDTWDMKGAVLTNVGLSVNANDMVVNTNATVIFSGLEVR